jgi:hypothetical protein
MTYFKELSFYSYDNEYPPAKNVGWLERCHEYEKEQPTEKTLDLLWSVCGISVALSRGGHLCDLCTPAQRVLAERNGAKLFLGLAEIRVVSKQSSASLMAERLRNTEHSGLIVVRKAAVPYNVYAAPTLLYHYVETHHYKPPDEFLRALNEGPRPPDPEYFEQLKKLDMEWSETKGHV